MSDKSKILQLITVEIRPRLKDLKTEHDKQIARFDPLNKRLGEAMQKQDPAMIKLYLKLAKPEIDWAGELLARASKLMKVLEKIDVNGIAKDEFQALEQATKELSELRGHFEKNFANLKAGEDKANDILAKYEKSGGAFAEEWASMESTMRDYLANVNWRLNQSNMVVKKAHQAVAERNQDELNSLATISAKYRQGNPSQSEVDAQLKKLLARAKASGLDANAKDQLDRELPALKKSFDDAGELEEKMFQNMEEIKGLKLKPVDYKKAATVLKAPQLASKFKSALEKTGAALEKELDTIGKELKPKLTGKEIIAELKKQKVM